LSTSSRAAPESQTATQLTTVAVKKISRWLNNGSIDPVGFLSA